MGKAFMPVFLLVVLLIILPACEEDKDPDSYQYRGPVEVLHPITEDASRPAQLLTPSDAESARQPAATTSRVPNYPLNLYASDVTSNKVTLNWTDNSSNETGFWVYNDGALADTCSANDDDCTVYGLSPGTQYRFTVVAYNDFASATSMPCVVTTKNPSLWVRLDKLGVYHNGESRLRGIGEIVLELAVSDGNNTEVVRFPPGEGTYYEMEENDVIDIRQKVFYSDDLGDHLTIIATCYELDGDTVEMLLAGILGPLAMGYMTGGSSTGALSLLGVDSESLVSHIIGSGNDHLGTYKVVRNRSENFGIGTFYTDVSSDNLRLWFTIGSDDI